MAKSAVITGAGSGIGRALAEAMAARGCQVGLADIDELSLERVAEGIRRRGGGVHSALVDVCDADAVAVFMSDIRAQTGRLDYVFNNAGIAVAGEARNMPLRDWQRVLDVDLRGVVHGVTAAYPIMIEQGFGHIVNIASLAGLVPSPNLAAYAAAKHGVVGLSVSLRHEAKPHGVRVSAVCPGLIDTPLKERVELRGMNRVKVRQKLAGKGVSVEKCARAILRGVDRNRPIITVGGHAHFLYHFYRLHPRLYTWTMESPVMRVLHSLRSGPE